MRSSDAVTTTTRLLPLQGGRNFRDLGGYQTHDGRSVRWGRLYRSGSMAALTTADCELLNGFGIRLVCDLRTTSERATAPSSRSEEHTSELQSLMRISYAVFCLKKKIIYTRKPLDEQQ